jgi:hypothetical protein
MNTRVQLATLKKGGLSATEYFNKMKTLADTLAIIGQPLKDEEYTAYLLAGLDESYDSLVISVTTRDDPIPLSELFVYLLSKESHIESRQSTPKTNEYPANYVNRGRDRAPVRGGNRGGQGGGRSNSARCGNFNTTASGGTTGKKNPCQICGKLGHSDAKCWYRYDQGVEEEYGANAATTSYNTDSSWYIDTGATYHITNDLEKLTAKEKYQGIDQVIVANGQGMYIRYIGQTKFHIASRVLVLRNILHVTSITKNLLSVRKFAIDNHVFFEFHPHFLLVKDLATKEVLIRGWCQDGFYMLNLASLHTASQSSRVSKSQWHCRLRHASPQIIQKLISCFHLPCLYNFNNNACNACQPAKSHQFPYSLSNNSVSSPPVSIGTNPSLGPTDDSMLVATGEQQVLDAHVSKYSEQADADHDILQPQSGSVEELEGVSAPTVQ